MGIEEFVLDQAKKEAYNEGFEMGFQEGFQIGIQKCKKETTLKMKEYGLDVNLIAEIIGLSVSEIENMS